MNLKILLPYRILLELAAVRRIVLQTAAGSIGILPNRLDFSAIVRPGLMVYEDGDGVEYYAALGDGLVVKCGQDVRVAVRNAVAGANLGLLKTAAEKEFMESGDTEKELKALLTQLEVELMKGLTGAKP